MNKIGRPSIIGVIQARMGSQRLPGKSCADLAGQPLLWRFIERVKRAQNLQILVLATTSKTEDDILAGIARHHGVHVFRGQENDLVDRIYNAALCHQAEIVVRLCADNPIIEPDEIDRIIQTHILGNYDFSSNLYNIEDNGYPDGLGAEVYNFRLLREILDLTDDPRNREHPHTWIYEHPEQYRIGTVKCPPGFRRPELKFEVNTEMDLKFLRDIYDYWYPKKHEFHITDVLWWLDNIISISS